MDTSQTPDGFDGYNGQIVFLLSDENTPKHVGGYTMSDVILQMKLVGFSELLRSCSFNPLTGEALSDNCFYLLIML